MVVMGKVVAAHGIRGWVKIQPYTEYLDSLLDYETWHFSRDQQNWRPLEVLEADVHGKVVVAHLQGVEDRTAAEACRGLLIGVPRAELPEEDEGEYYWSDLIGMTVVNLADEVLGTVDTLLETGANDVLSVRDAQGKEILIPFIAQTIRQVDRQGRTIRVDWQADYLK